MDVSLPNSPLAAGPPRPSPTAGAGAVGRVLDGGEARELVAALRGADPLRAAFDAAVRRFVRAERAHGHDLETILAALASVLRAHVEPALDPAHRRALRDAVAWFAVSEFHRAD